MRFILPLLLFCVVVNQLPLISGMNNKVSKDDLHRKLFCNLCTSRKGFFADLSTSYVSVSSTMKYHNLRWLCVQDFMKSPHWLFLVGYETATSCDMNQMTSLIGMGGISTKLFRELQFQTLKAQYDLRNCTSHLRVDFPRQLYPQQIFSKLKIEIPPDTTPIPYFKIRNNALLQNYTANAVNSTTNFLV